MKTKIIQLAVVLVEVILSSISVFADPLNNWHWRNPLPNGNSPGFGNRLYGIVFANGQFFAVGANGIEANSTDGTNWFQRTTATTQTLSDIINANGQFMAVGNGGAVETSTDGTNWVLQNSGTSASLSSVAFGNGGYVAVGGGVIIASPDGVTWAPATSGPSDATQVAGSSSGFVALNGIANTYFSANGLTWTTNILTAPGNAYGGASIVAPFVIFTKGSYLIPASRYASSSSADVFVFASSDGRNWTTNVVGNIVGTEEYGFQYYFFMAGNGNAIAGGSYRAIPFILSSSNNVNWSFNSYEGPVPGIIGEVGAYGNGLYVIVYSTSAMYSSTDGINWATTTPNIMTATGPTSTFNSITYSNGIFVVASSNLVVSTNGLVYNVESNTPSLSSVTAFGSGFVGAGTNGAIYQSSDGITWTQRVSGTANNLRCVVGGGNQLVAVGDGGTIQTSPDGVTWTSQASHVTAQLFSVAYSNGLYVAVGNSGATLHSPDGINWTLKLSGHTNSLSSITYGSAGFLAVGTVGMVLTSPDGVNWTQQNAGTSATLESATFGNGYYLITGTSALVLTSPDGVNWTSRNIGATAGPTLYGSGFLNGRFDVVGSGGTILESDPVSPLFDLQMHAKPFQNVFTIFTTPGSSFRILSSSDLSGNSWSTAATFNNAAAITLWTNSVSGGNQYLRLVSP